MVTVKLAHGLAYRDASVFEIRLKPLSIGGELAAFALIDDLPDLPEGASQAERLKRDVYETLAYWAQQIEADGIPAEAVTADWLMANLSGEDYQAVMAAQEDLRRKPSAATENPVRP
ncbi:hypothetical protein [Neisseria blantyrii]|uniref:hypothetical protein n=1 Tax=Neisseria blantyrii TaxID=2830647 RepID=UPI00265A49EA|nr:hypothetical protein [Neisseria blantyrii]